MSETIATLQANAGRGEKIDERASEFVLRRYDRTDWTDTDQTELDAWLEEALSHRAAFWRLKAAWLRADRLTALRPVAPDGDTSARGLRRNIGIKVAAVVVCVSASASTYWFTTRSTIQTFATAVGERQNLTLADGSKIELTTDTVLRVRTDGQHRTAWLDKGEAYFQIVHDQARPFVLHSAKLRIVDLGTEFSARQEANGTRVTVVKGSVGIERDGLQRTARLATLIPGDSALANTRSISVTRKSATEVADALGWRQGILIFRHTPLRQVVAEFSRYNHTTIRLADPSIGGLTISARLPATDVKVFARMAQNFLGLHVRQNGNEIELSAEQAPTPAVEQH